MASNFCKACGAPKPEGAQFCTGCGAQSDSGQAQQPAQPPPTSPQPPAPAQQYVQQAPAYAPQVPPPPKKSGAGKVIGFVLLGIVGTAALVFGALVVIGLVVGAGNGGDKPVASNIAQWQPTYDQNRVLSEFGAPQAFLVAYGEDHLEDLEGGGELPIHRVESWDYFDMKTRFLFKDGEAIGTEDLPETPSAPYYPQFSPLDFEYGMNADDVTAFVGLDPSVETQPSPDILPGVTITSYYNQLFITYEDGLLIGVEAPVRASEGGGL